MSKYEIPHKDIPSTPIAYLVANYRCIFIGRNTAYQIIESGALKHMLFDTNAFNLANVNLFFMYLPEVNLVVAANPSIMLSNFNTEHSDETNNLAIAISSLPTKEARLIMLQVTERNTVHGFI